MFPGREVFKKARFKKESFITRLALEGGHCVYNIYKVWVINLSVFYVSVRSCVQSVRFVFRVFV